MRKTKKVVKGGPIKIISIKKNPITGKKPTKKSSPLKQSKNVYKRKK